MQFFVDDVLMYFLLYSEVKKVLSVIAAPPSIFMARYFVFKAVKSVDKKIIL